LNDAIHRRAECRARPRAWPVNGDPLRDAHRATHPIFWPQNRRAILVHTGRRIMADPKIHFPLGARDAFL
jgi:hypothetical protein